MRGMSGISRQVTGETAGRWLTCVLSMAMALLIVATASWAAEPANKLLSVEVDQTAEVPTILIQTADPVGYRYTVYDSFDPVRIVIDFPGMEMADGVANLPIGQGELKEVRVSNFDLASGNLVRVEILLDENTEYRVSLDGNDFRIAFADLDATAEPTRSMQVAAKPAPVQPAASTATSAAGGVLEQVVLSPGEALLKTDGEIQAYKSFTLPNPARLVVDIFGVQPAFKQKTFSAEAGISKVRIGAYPDKTRVVFDATGTTLPEHTIDRQATDIIVNWNERLTAAAAGAPAAAAPPVASAVAAAAPQLESSQARTGTVEIEAIDFDSADGRSYVSVSLSGPTRVTGPTLEGNLVRFVIKNATISRALRRTIDASAFPTAVSSVTPYTVTENGRQDVRLAVTLKGPVAYALEQDGTLIRLVVDDGPYAEAAPPAVSVVELAAPTLPQRSTTAGREISTMGVVDDSLLEQDAPAYTGQKISLVFDSADIRSILQLIGEVSDLNILASSDVSGNITLRLIDVPWDQALALILETADLGKIQEGNVLRIMPRDKIREMRQSERQVLQQEVEEAVLESRVFQVSYSSVDDVKTAVGDLLTDRGKIIPDARNKQMIVKDVPTVLDEMAVLIKQIDQPEKQVMIEARIVEANTNYSRDLGVKWGLAYDNDADNDGGGVGSNGLASSGLGLGGAFLIPTPGAGSVGAAGAAAGLSFGTVGVDTLTIDLRLSALESAGEGKIISTPRVTTLNGQAAKISQGTKIPYTTVSDTGTETSFENAELSLEVTPEINPDGTVILQINASNSAVGSIVPTGTGNAISIDEKKAETKVLVRDGETTVIGGIFVEDERDADTGVPLLKDIPFVGHLFKSTLKTRDRRELLIFITPRILN